MGRSFASKVRDWIGTVAFAAAGIAILHFVSAARVRTLSGELPSFAAQTSNGTTVRSDDLRGKVLLLNFWSPG